MEQVAVYEVKEALHDRSAEESTLGAVFINPDSFYEISDFLHADDFYTHHHRWAWDAFTDISREGNTIDLITFCDALGKNLQEFGGQAYVMALISQVPSSLRIREYADIVKGFSKRRNALDIANRIAQDAYDTNKPFDITPHAMKIANNDNGTGRHNSKDSASKAIDMVLNPQFMTTGVSDVDKFIGGYFPDELAVLAGYQGTGKSAMMLHGARMNADNGATVMLASQEMSAAQCYLKIACGELGINPSILRAGNVSPKAKQEVIDMAGHMGDKYQDKIIIYDTRRSPSGIMAAAMREQPDILYIDTLKNIGGKNGEALHEWYDFVVEYLRSNIAKRLHIPVILLHHLNRSSKRDNREPGMQDLKYAGESDSDAVHILHRDGEAFPGQKIAGIKWICSKARFGSTGSAEINFNLEKQSFHSLAKER